MNKAAVDLFWTSVGLAMFAMAIIHRYDISGVVWAMLWLAEQKSV